MSVSDSDNNVILVGGFHEVIELCEACGKRIVAIVDNTLIDECCGYKILGNDSIALSLYKKHKETPIVITPDAPSTRRELVRHYSEIGFAFCSLVHPNATISKSAKVGKGVFIQDGVCVSANVVIEDFVRINKFACIMHDSSIGAYSSVAPSAVILGRVRVLECCYIGANSTILPEKVVGRGAIVGAGAVVTRNVREETTCGGVPAREIRRIRKNV